MWNGLSRPQTLTQAIVMPILMPIVPIAWPVCRVPFVANCALVHRSSKAIHETATKLAVQSGWTSPDPRAGVAIKLGGSDARGIRDVVVVGQGRTGERLASEEAPPPFNQIEPGGADRNEGVLNARMSRQPVLNGATGVAGEIVGNQVQVTLRIRLVEGLQQREVASGVARGCRLGEHVAVPHAECAVDPHLVGSPLIVERHLDAVPVR